LCFVWLLGNTAFVLCIGDKWGFECFPRFTVPAMPAFFWSIRRILPRGVWPWTAIAVVSAAIAIFSV